MSLLAAAEQDRKTKTTPPKRIFPEDTQQTCIDLPGETVRCTVYKPKLEIMLRKHRDVIFELQLFNGMGYTVEADQNDFYSARDKKLFEFKKKHKIAFKDGERLHLWVSREFKGSLILKANGKVMGRYQPNSLDKNRYDDDPSTKPAPLIIVMKNEQPSTFAALPLAAHPAGSIGAGSTIGMGVLNYDPLAFSQPRSVSEQAQSMHVVEVKPGPDMPQQVADFFKQGGEQTALDANGIMTRNWLWVQMTGSVAYLSDNKPWIKEMWRQRFYLQRVKHKAGEKVYVVFKGSPGLRTFLSGTRYAATHAKVLAITAGAGTAAGLRHAAWEGAKGAMKKGGALTVIFATVINVAEWLVDYEERDPATGKPKKDFFDLVFKIGIDVVKAVISAAIGSLVMGGFVGLFALGAIALPVYLVVIGTVVAAVGVGYLIDLADKKTGATDKLNKLIRDPAKYLEDKLPRDYSGYGGAIENACSFGTGT